MFQQAVANQGMLLFAAVLVIYIILGILYESFIHPLTILSGLPSAGIGALLILMIFNMDLSVIAMIGVVMLIGIVKKNAIMMVDFAIERRAQGATAEEAIVEAARLRFRPIMMTTVCALLGAMPIAVGAGAGAELRQPLGITVVGGLIVSQLLTLFITPVVYIWFDRLTGMQFKPRWSKRRAAADARRIARTMTTTRSGPSCRARVCGCAGRVGGPLADLTFAAKDLFDVAGVPTGGGNHDWPTGRPMPSKHSWAVQTLLDAGATLIGKTITDEVSLGILGENAFDGTPLNTRAPDRVPGGSSSGSAAAVAAGICDTALGTDTGGSVRVPASFCGLYGIRPTHGRIDTTGMLPQAPTSDTTGWFARDAGTFARVSAVMLGEAIPSVLPDQAGDRGRHVRLRRRRRRRRSAADGDEARGPDRRVSARTSWRRKASRSGRARNARCSRSRPTTPSRTGSTSAIRASPSRSPRRWSWAR